MQDKFLESIRTGFINQIEEIISETKLSSEEKGLNAIDTLVLVNNNINSWISSINGMFNVDEELLTKVAELKRPFVSAAKKEVASEVAKIIENELTDVTSKINDFMSRLKKKGIDLDGDNKKEEKRTTTTFESQTYLKPIETTTPFGSQTYSKPIGTSALDSEFSFGASRQRVLKREESSKRSTSDCSPDWCGGSSKCGDC